MYPNTRFFLYHLTFQASSRWRNQSNSKKTTDKIMQSVYTKKRLVNDMLLQFYACFTQEIVKSVPVRAIGTQQRYYLHLFNTHSQGIYRAKVLISFGRVEERWRSAPKPVRNGAKQQKRDRMKRTARRQRRRRR